MKKKLYFVGNKESEAKNSWLAIASCRETAEAKMSEMSDTHGATVVVEKLIDMRSKRRGKGAK
jgi:hypothetical protein